MIDRNGAAWLFICGVVLMFTLAAFMGTAGCLRTAAGTVWQAVVPLEVADQQVNKTEPVITPVVELTSPPQIYVEPIADQLYRLGKRDIGQFFTWRRYNVSGQKDMTVKVTIYRYQFLTRYQWWSNGYGRYFWQFPGPGNKFLVIYPYMEMVGEDQSQDPRYFVSEVPWDRWAIDYNQTLYYPDENYVKGIRIRELEEVFTLNNDDRVKPWGYFWHNFGYSDDEEYHGIVAVSPQWLRMGRSNAWDGYVLIEVPEAARPEDLKVVSNWGAFGSAYWQL